MVTEFKSLIHLLDHFKEESVCVEYLIAARWSGKICCPHCGNEKIYVTNRGYKCADKDCGKKFTVTSGTVLENTKISLRLWFAAIYLATAHKKGISSLQLSRDLNITQKTAWFLLHRIREMFNNNAPEILNNTVEIDETYVGGKIKNKHVSKRKTIKNSTSPSIKTAVLGMLERGGSIITQVIPDVKRSTVLPIIERAIATSATINTDSSHMYTPLKLTYKHDSVNHEQSEYVRGEIHTNTLEGYWSLLKRGIIGIYHSVSPKHLHRYCNEFQYRYNTRELKDGNRFELALKIINGKRLTYAGVIS